MGGGSGDVAGCSVVAREESSGRSSFFLLHEADIAASIATAPVLIAVLRSIISGLAKRLWSGQDSMLSPLAFYANCYRLSSVFCRLLYM